MRFIKNKIVCFFPGLGNQLIVYLFCKFLEHKGNRVYAYFRLGDPNQHNGAKEILDCFDVDMPSSPWWLRYYISFLYRFPRLRPIPNFIGTEDTANYSEFVGAVLYKGYWQDIELYFDGNRDFFFGEAKKIKFRLPEDLGKNNTELKSLIESRPCISVHVRRGDYLHHPELFGGICTSEYYANALRKVKEQYNNPLVIAFSDEPAWVEDNFGFQGIEHLIVGWNKGRRSYLDMYLMSLCASSIIANSTFSYWGALLGVDKDMVIYPKAWFEKQGQRICPDHWIGI